MFKLENGTKVLFQGDSITDAGRINDPREIGCGYFAFIWAYLNAKCPELNINLINKGYTGNLSEDILRRWKTDCLDINPDILVLMAGINDMWRRYDGADRITTSEKFEANMREILTQTKNAGINKIILLEPFLTMNEPDREIWLKEDLCYKQEVVKKLADEFDCMFIPLQSIFDEACKLREPSFWTNEGVHPLWPGCGLIAKHVLKCFGFEL